MIMEELYKIYQAHPQVFIDTRKELKDAIFVAVGQKNELGAHRGNQFAEMAIDSGKAKYAIINDPILKAKHADNEAYILVEDGEKALQALATYHRQHLNMPILAIGGSNGKTTIKELLHGVLSSKFKTFSTSGNLNNHLGVPLSLLSIDNSYEMVVLEIGANHLEETRFLAEMIQPDFGLVTNCGKDHLGEYGSIENIVKANKELYDVIAESSKKAFVCENDALLLEISSHVNERILYGQTAEVTAKILETPFLKFQLNINQEDTVVQTNLFGRFWLDALIGAAAVGHYFGINISSIKTALEAYQPAALRSQLVDWKGNKVLLDCYNANPSSMEVFLAEIQQSSMSEPKILVLGEMLELGTYSQEEHQRLLDSIEPSQFEDVLLVGDEFSNVNIPEVFHSFIERKEVSSYLSEKKHQGKYFFVKGSRGNRLETLFQ